MGLTALPTEFEVDLTTYLPETLPEILLDGHVWVAVSTVDLLPDNPEHAERWFETKHVCRRCRRVAKTTNGRTLPRVFVVRLGQHTAEACPKGERRTRVWLWLRGRGFPTGPAIR